jgi:hypothetical protein
MHYALTLDDPDRVAAVRARIALRGPAFDDLPGLACKLFLIDPVDPCYALFYLWHEPDRALAFLEGPLFKALCDAYGRPEVKLLLTHATAFPFPTGSEVFLTLGGGAAASAGAVALLDPREGETYLLGHAGARRFEVMYRAGKIARPGGEALSTFTEEAAGAIAR